MREDGFRVGVGVGMGSRDLQVKGVLTLYINKPHAKEMHNIVTKNDKLYLSIISSKVNFVIYAHTRM